MRNKISIIFLIIFFIGYYFYPKSGTLNSFAFYNFNKSSIEKIEIRNTSSMKDKSIRDKDKINEIVSNISGIKITQSYDSTLGKARGSYYIYIYDKNTIPMEIVIQNKEYINVINDSNKSYKIIENSFDTDYIDRLISE